MSFLNAEWQAMIHLFHFTAFEQQLILKKDAWRCDGRHRRSVQNFSEGDKTPKNFTLLLKIQQQYIFKMKQQSNKPWFIPAATREWGSY